MLKLEYSPYALDKLGAIYRYIANELYNPNGAANTISSIRDKIRKLKTMPNLGAPLSSRCHFVPEHLDDVRVLLCGNYIALYKHDEKLIRVLNIYHTAEDYVSHIFEIK